MGWSDVHFKCYLTTHGITTPGEEANKKRQRSDGRNYHIKVARPSVVADYQKEMGWVDRHNRFRQGMLKFDEVWKTKRWQTRIQLDIIGMTIVDAFLLARKFIPRWGNQPDTESVFFKVVRRLLPLMGDPLHGSSEIDDNSSRRCHQVLIGKRIVQEGPKKGLKYTKQMRCYYCGTAKRKEMKRDGFPGTKSPRTSYTCIGHNTTYMCQKGKGTCWEEHLCAVQALELSFASSETE